MTALRTYLALRAVVPVLDLPVLDLPVEDLFSHMGSELWVFELAIACGVEPSFSLPMWELIAPVEVEIVSGLCEEGFWNYLGLDPDELDGEVGAIVRRVLHIVACLTVSEAGARADRLMASGARFEPTFFRYSVAVARSARSLPNDEPLRQRLVSVIRPQLENPN